MKTFFTIVWYLIRIVFVISRFLLMKLVLGPLLYLVRPFFAAVRYLTILPVPRWLGGGAKDLRRSLVHVPLVGVVLGAMVGGFAWLTPHVFGDLVSSALIVLMLLVLSGGGTLRGLAHSADGLLGDDPKKHMLAHPAPTTIGAMGAAAVVCVLILKFAALAEMEFVRRSAAAILIPVAGRCAMVIAMGVLRCIPRGAPAGSAETGRTLFRTPSVAGRILLAVWASALLGGAAVVVYGLRSTPEGHRLELASVVQGAVASVMAILCALLLAWFVRRRLGGATPQTLGAICEVAEAGMIVFLAAYEFLGYVTSPIDTRGPSVSPAEEAQWFLLGPMMGT